MEVVGSPFCGAVDGAHLIPLKIQHSVFPEEQDLTGFPSLLPPGHLEAIWEGRSAAPHRGEKNHLKIHE